MKRSIIILLFWIVCAHVIFAKTQIQEFLGNYPECIAFSPDNTCYFGYNGGNYSQLIISHKSGDTWETENIGSSGIFISDGAISFNSEGNPGIAAAPGLWGVNMKYIYFNGTSWIETDTGERGYGPALFYMGNNIPTIIYINEIVGLGKPLFLSWMQYTGGTWHKEVIDSSNSAQESSSRRDSGGNLHVAYIVKYGDQTYDLRYATLIGSTWSIQTIVTYTHLIWWCSLAFDSSNRPGIAYVEDTVPAKLYYIKHNGTSWQIDTVLSEDWLSGAALSFDGMDRPFIAYQNRKLGKIAYLYKDAGGWHSPITIEQKSGSSYYGFCPTIAFDTSNILWIGYGWINDMDAYTTRIARISDYSSLHVSVWDLYQ